MFLKILLIGKLISLCILGGFVSSMDAAQNLREGIIDLCESLKNDVVPLVDAVAPPDFILNSPLGCSDGNVIFICTFLTLSKVD